MQDSILNHDLSNVGSLTPLTSFSGKFSLCHERTELNRQFIEHFESLGFTQIPPVSLICEQDKSVFFTVASITAIKPYIFEDKLPPNGVVVSQPCLRCHGLAIDNPTVDNPLYISTHTMLGALLIPEHDSQLSAWVISTIEKVLKINLSRIVIEYSPEVADIANILLERNPILDSFCTTTAPDRFVWKFGHESLRGWGVNIDIIQADGQRRQNGNLIEVVYNNKVIGYEFGFVIEPALAWKHSLPTAFEASVISEIIPLNNSPILRLLADDLVIATSLLVHGVINSRKKEGQILRRVLKRLFETCDQIGIPRTDLEQYAQKYGERALDSDCGGELLRAQRDSLDDWKKRNKDSMAEYIKLRWRGVNSGHELPSEALEKIITASNKNYYLSFNDLNLILDRVIGDNWREIFK